MERSAQVAAPARLGLRRLAPHPGLAALLVIVLTVGLSWALLVPPWQSPDELAQFAFVQSIAENFTIPHTSGGPYASSDLIDAEAAVGASRGAFWPEPAPPDWQRSDYAAYLAAEHSAHPPSRTNGTGPSTATNNPPLFYLVAAVPYLIDHGGTAFGRLYSIRIFGVLLLLLTTVAAWLLAGEVFARRRLPQLGCAAAVGLLPMAGFMSTAVNPEALLMLLWTLTLWLGARVINHRARRLDVMCMWAATAAAILTKATSYALVGPILVALLFGWLRRPPAERRRALIPIAAGGLVLAVPVLSWVALASSLGGLGITTVGSSPTHPFLISQFFSYLWQFYLPRLPSLTPLRATPDLPVYDIWLRQLTGTFGWLDVYLPTWMYRAATFAATGLGLGSVALLTRLRKRRHLALLTFFALALLALLAVLHVTEYRALISGAGQFLQGRYLLPAVSLFGLAVGLVIARAPTRLRPTACALALTALLVMQVISLSTSLHAYFL
jgi:4-amino-4-deoxy-L-arabinose transferase-like glycosyltransferase